MSINLKLVNLLFFFLLWLNSSIYSQSTSFDDKIFSIFENQRINSITHLENEILYIAAENGLFSIINKKKIFNYSGEPISWFYYRKDYKYFSTYMGEIYKIIGEKKKPLLIFSDSTQIIESFIVDKYDNIWILGQNGILLHFNSSNQKIESLKYKNVTDISYDNDNHIWISTYNGFYNLNIFSFKDKRMIKNLKIYKHTKHKDHYYLLFDEKNKSSLVQFNFLTKEKNRIKLSENFTDTRINTTLFNDDEYYLANSNLFLRKKNKTRWKNLLNLNGISITSILKIGDEILLGTDGKGIIVLNENSNNNEDNNFVYLESQKINLNEKVNLKNIIFEKNDSLLSVDAQKQLFSLANLLNKHKGLKVFIEGHTSKSNDSNLALKLSNARAREVQKFLKISGVNENRISYKGWGNLMPINRDLKNQANQRVEITLSKIDN